MTKVSELEGAELDMAVAVAIGRSEDNCDMDAPFSPSTDWAHGGPLIEREKLDLYPDRPDGWRCGGYAVNKVTEAGRTPLIAAMRCIVANWVRQKRMGARFPT